jgi:hypothetical protein
MRTLPSRAFRPTSLKALVALASFGVATTASGQLLLDQESPFELGFTQFSERPAAQTFTVGASGDLESVEVYVSQLSPTGNLLISIYALEGDAPPLAPEVLPLATGSIPTSELPSSSAGGTGPAFVWIDLDAPLPVDAGERLALVLQKDSGGTTGAGQIVWAGNPGRYADGQALRYDAGGIVFCTGGPPCDPPFEPPSWKTYGSLGDFGFRTYVPEPSLPLLLAIGGPALLGLRRLRSRPSGTRSTRR